MHVPRTALYPAILLSMAAFGRTGTSRRNGVAVSAVVECLRCCDGHVVGHVIEDRVCRGGRRPGARTRWRGAMTATETTKAPATGGCTQQRIFASLFALALFHGNVVVPIGEAGVIPASKSSSILPRSRGAAATPDGRAPLLSQSAAAGHCLSMANCATAPPVGDGEIVARGDP